jgi:RNA polymerase sigma factor (sigma-70 family)
MRDSEVVESIAATDPAGLADVYDRYADPLYKYCRSMLGDPADAADAVQDTFVIAASRLGGLRDAERLHAWLYAVARNECLRIGRARKTAPALHEAPEVTGEGGLAGDDAEWADLLALVEDAARGLNPAEREVIELRLRQGLEPGEIAILLGVSRNRVQSLLSRARDHMLASLDVLLVGRAGREECRELASMLSGWDGRLSVPLRKRVHRHIGRCGVCTARCAYELRPAMLLGLSPVAAIVAAAAQSLRSAAGPPAALRSHTLALAADHTPSAIAHRAAVLNRAGSFGRDGFPKPVHVPMAPLPRATGKDAWRSPRRERAIVAAGVVLAVAVAAAVAVFVLGGHSGHGALPGGKPPVSAPGAGATGTSDAAAPSASPTAARHRATSATPTAKPTVPASPTPTSASPASSSPAPRSPTPASSPPKTPSPSPSPTSVSATPSGSPSSPSPGTLAVSPAGGDLTVPAGGATVTLTARGGAVNWSITVSGGLGQVAVEPSAGTLKRAGDTVTVTISANLVAWGRQLTVSPSGTQFTLVTSLGDGLLPAGEPRSAPATPRV